MFKKIINYIVIMSQTIYNLEYNISLIYLDKYIDNNNLLLILNENNKNIVYLGRVNFFKNKNIFSSNEELLISLCRNDNVEFIYDESEFELVNKKDNIHLQFENVSYNKTFYIKINNNDNVLDLFLSKLNYDYCLLERNDNLNIDIGNIKLIFNFDDLDLVSSKHLLEAKIKTNISLNNNKVRELTNNLKSLKLKNNLLEENMRLLFL